MIKSKRCLYKLTFGSGNKRVVITLSFFVFAYTKQRQLVCTIGLTTCSSSQSIFDKFRLFHCSFVPPRIFDDDFIVIVNVIHLSGVNSKSLVIFSDVRMYSFEAALSADNVSPDFAGLSICEAILHLLWNRYRFSPFCSKLILFL